MKVHHVERDANQDRRTTSSAWINIGNDKGSLLWVRQQSKDMQATRPCAPDPWLLNPKINKLRHIVEDYYCAKFQVIPISGFCFIVLTHTPTHIHTHTYIMTQWLQYPYWRRSMAAWTIIIFLQLHTVVTSQALKSSRGLTHAQFHFHNRQLTYNWHWQVSIFTGLSSFTFAMQKPQQEIAFSHYWRVMMMK